MTNIIKRFFKLDLWALAAVLLALPLLIPFLQNGLPQIDTSGLHIHRLVSVGSGFESGVLWPRWSPYLHLGYGAPLTDFYAPGVYWLGGLLWRILPFSAVTVYKLLFAVILLVYPLGAYYWVRTFGTRAGALVAAAAYVYAPLNFRQLWIEQNLAQFAALALVPWVLWALQRAAIYRTRWRVIVAAFFIAALILTHHATAILFAPFILLYLLLVTLTYPHGMRRLVFVYMGLSLVIGLLLSTIYWLPALAELSYTHTPALRDVPAVVSADTVSLSQLFAATQAVDQAQLNWAEAGSFAPRVGQVHALLVVLALLFIWRLRGSARVYALSSVAVFMVALFLASDFAAPLWDSPVLRSYLQVPWYMLAVAALMGAAAAAFVPVVFGVGLRTIVAFAIMAALAVSALPMLYAPLNMTPLGDLSPADAVRYELSTGYLGLAVGGDYLPRWVTQRPQDAPQDALLNSYATAPWYIALDDEATLPAGADVTHTTDEAGVNRYVINTPEPFTLVLRQFYFPGWEAALDGATVNIAPTEPRGLISIDIPAGEHELRLVYVGTTVQFIATVITLLALAGALATVILPLRSLQRSVPIEQTPRLESWLPAAVVLGLVGFVVTNIVFITPATDWFRPSSDPQNPPMQYPLHVVLGDTIELLGYDLAQTQAAPGDSIEVRLYWRLLQPIEQSLSGSVQVTARDRSAVWGRGDHFQLASLNTARWPIDRYVVDRYTVEIAPDAPPFVGELRVAVFVAGSNEPLLTPEGERSVKLADFRITGDQRLFKDDMRNRGDILFGDYVALVGLEFEQAEAETCVLLRWRAERDGERDYNIMLHLRDSLGETLAIVDAPPLDNLYPTSLWLRGQILDDRHCFERPEAATTLALGLYDLNSRRRIPAVLAGTRLEEDTLLIPLP